MFAYQTALEDIVSYTNTDNRFFFSSDQYNKYGIYFCLCADPFKIFETVKRGVPQISHKTTGGPASARVCLHTFPQDLEDKGELKPK